MAKPAFNHKKSIVVDEIPNHIGGSPTQTFDFPVTPKEAFIALYNREPVWQLMGIESRIFTPKLLPDNVARAFVLEDEPFDMSGGGGKDMFGIEWEYVPSAFGSMVRPGNPFLTDANEWRDKIVWPDIDSWDWESSAKRNNDTYLTSDNVNSCWFQTGFFERLISLMDFDGAIMALVDEDQKGATKELLDKLSDLYIRIFDKFLTYFPKIDVFTIHDDWGSQQETFFSPALVEEMIVPYMKKTTDFIHSKGKICDFHSCGQLRKQVPNMIAAGWDSWEGQSVNDTHEIYELYGDKIIIGVIPDTLDPETTTEEEQRAAARAYADKFSNPNKPSYLNSYGMGFLTPAFREELYARSRENYSK